MYWDIFYNIKAKQTFMKNIRTKWTFTKKKKWNIKIDFSIILLRVNLCSSLLGLVDSWDVL